MRTVNSIVRVPSKRTYSDLFLLLLLGAAAGFLSVRGAKAQGAAIYEARESIKTYPFGDADPVPSVYLNEGMYPYFRFDGFSHTSEAQEWTVIHLENPYIHVTVLPEVGGKVWGAIEKSTGNEFVYKNDVLKFRDIAVRGPWTSGGIEYNFSVYGHAPTVATPVNYLVRENEDGSVSVVVGATDWTSRTRWLVTMTVPEDEAYLKIENLWYNPTPLNALRYHWLNAAVQARQDLQFFFPGDHYIGHGGDAHSWPIDEQGRNLSYYRNNDFGGSKSYHVLGGYTDFYGGYWHDLDFGFGHWAPYADAPGKKIWIWSHARSGAIWEDLLTDSDGQYVEVQAGRKFNQTRGMTRTPFAQTFFPPYATDRWAETFFPVKGTDGMVDASHYGVLNVSREGNTLEITVNALAHLDDTLTVEVGGEQVHNERLALAPMEVAHRTVALPSGSGTVVVSAGGSSLLYTSDEDVDDLERPMRSTLEPDRTSAAWHYRQAEKLNKARRYEQALHAYLNVLEEEPTHARALGRVAALYYRRGAYEKSLRYASKALQINTYDPYANYIYGIAQRQTGDLVDAKEALGWAARSPKYRSGAYTQMAGIHLHENNFERAATYARHALDYNQYNLSAYEALAISYRKRGREEEAHRVLNRLLEIDPLSHFARFERYLLDPTPENLEAFMAMIRGEFRHEIYLELAVQYVNRGQADEAIRVLKEAPADPIVYYWLAYLSRKRSPEASREYLEKALSLSPRLVFPFRRETLPVLEWALDQKDAWETKYYLGTLYWSKRREKRATVLYEQCGEEPDFAPFYLARAFLHRELQRENGSVGGQPERLVSDFRRAIQAGENMWRAWRALIIRYNRQGQFEQALSASREAYKRFPGNYYIGLEHAATLLNSQRYAESAHVLDEVRVLPYEGAQRGHDLFEQAHMLLALEQLMAGRYEQALKHVKRSKQWPEHLGVGKPYGPDTRLQNYLAAYAYRQLGREKEARECLEAIVAYTEENWSDWGINHYISAVALRDLGNEERARKLLEDWHEAVESTRLVASWATAKFSGSEGEAQRLARSMRSRDGSPDTFFILHQLLQIKAAER